MSADFEKISGFAINPAKTELYPVGLTKTTHAEIQSLYDFKLGVLIPLHLWDLFKGNYTPLFSRVKKNIRNWSTKWLTCLERLESVKSIVLPQFLFLFQSLLIDISAKCVAHWQKELNNFI